MEKVCPRCQNSSYQVPGLKLLVNTCGHKLCEACVDVVFGRPTAPCPECGIILRKNQFRLQQFEDSRVEIEVDIRKKILKDFNKTEDDFATLREYNDYLEDVETIIFNLSNGVDVEETKARVDTYRKENQTLIMRNRMKQQRYQQVLSTQLAQEKAEVELRNEEALVKEVEMAKMKRKQKESILDDLMFSDRPASEVLASHMASSERAKGEEGHAGPDSSKSEITYPSHMGQAGTTVYSTLPIETGKPYVYEPPTIETLGPEVPDLEDMESLGYVSSMVGLEEVQQGGGFLPAYGCRRALQEAFSCLLLFPDSNQDKSTLLS